MTKVGFPGAPMGMSQLDPSIGGLLTSLDPATIMEQTIREIKARKALDELRPLPAGRKQNRTR